MKKKVLIGISVAIGVIAIVMLIMFAAGFSFSAKLAAGKITVLANQRIEVIHAKHWDFYCRCNLGEDTEGKQVEIFWYETPVRKMGLLYSNRYINVDFYEVYDSENDTVVGWLNGYPDGRETCYFYTPEMRADWSDGRELSLETEGHLVLWAYPKLKQDFRLEKQYLVNGKAVDVLYGSYFVADNEISTIEFGGCKFNIRRVQ